MRTVTPAHLRWLKANKHSLGALTGQDHRALAAIDACWELFTVSDRPSEVLVAIRVLLPLLQEKCWYLARELIARHLDWGDRDRLWPKVEPAAPRKPYHPPVVRSRPVAPGDFKAAALDRAEHVLGAGPDDPEPASET